MNGLSSDVVKLRKLRNRYETNRDIKAYSLFVWLKSMSVSGFIHNYGKQLDSICGPLKISRATFYNYLNTAEDLQLIERNNGRLKLASWDKVVETLSLPEKTFRTIYYDTENQKQKLSLILEALEFEENKEKQEKAITNKIAKHPQVKSAFELFCRTHGITAEFTPDNLSKVKREAYKYGSAASIYSVIMNTVNPEVYRNASSIASAHGYKSPRLTTYLKTKLKRASLAVVSKGQKNVCSYAKNRIEGKERGKNENGTLYYRVKEKQKIWFEPDRVQISQFLFTAPPPKPPTPPSV